MEGKTRRANVTPTMSRGCRTHGNYRLGKCRDRVRATKDGLTCHKYAADAFESVRERAGVLPARAADVAAELAGCGAAAADADARKRVSCGSARWKRWQG